MNEFNLGAVLLVLLLLMWLGYAVPRISRRRELLGQAQEMNQERFTHTARDLTGGVRARQRSAKASPMAHRSQLLRPSTPIDRPRFEVQGAGRDLGAEVIAPVENRHRLLTAILLVLLVGALALTGTAIAGLTSWWLAAGVAWLAVMFATALRLTRTRRQRRAVRPARVQESAPLGQAAAAEADDAGSGAGSTATAAQAETAQPARSAVMGPAERHELFLREIIGTDAREQSQTYRYGTLSSATAPLEYARLEEIEAVEAETADAEAAAGMTIAEGLTLDEVLERRRA
ncbi:hypothetical protein [Helcobacillus massiliensis]|uniref:Uncharacterized protein n=1 Tax=Helcobacillus massiliensis TaxID=521392 RepID=A0A839QUW1_9MICO|nr:hypothetical protein [Helcobacillus massiliensis]MBB3022639.1 hypothetical protein [Helcobacillus massiliensis]